MQNYDWHLRRWFLYRFLKLLVDSRFNFVGTVSHNLEAIFTKVNCTSKLYKVIYKIRLRAKEARSKYERVCNKSNKSIATFSSSFFFFNFFSFLDTTTEDNDQTEGWKTYFATTRTSADLSLSILSTSLHPVANVHYWTRHKPFTYKPKLAGIFAVSIAIERIDIVHMY